MEKLKLFTIVSVVAFFVSCRSAAPESKFQHNKKYHVGKVRNLKAFLKLNDNERALSDSFEVDTFSETREFSKNRYRLYYDTIEYSGKVVIPQKLDYKSGRCFCSFSYGSIEVRIPYLYQAPIMLYHSINIFTKGRFQSYQTVINRQKKQIQSEEANRYQQLTLISTPKLNGSENLTGLLRFKTKGDSGQNKKVFSGGIYFTCEISKNKPPYPYR